MRMVLSLTLRPLLDPPAPLITIPLRWSFFQAMTLSSAGMTRCKGADRLRLSRPATAAYNATGEVNRMGFGLPLVAKNQLKRPAHLW